MVEDAPAEQAVTAADDPLAALHLHRKRRLWPWITAFVVVAAAVGLYFALRKKPPKHEWITGHVSRGDLVEKVEATGTVNAITNAQVSSQVSGRIARIDVDFNQPVHRGDVLAVLDPLPFQAQVRSVQAVLAQATANARKADADLTLARHNADRARQLRERNLNAQADLDAAIAAEADAVAQLGVTRAAMQQARAALSTAQANLDYSTIRAPCDGIVLARNVDVGGTVAASFSAPTLFVIVDDLSRVQVIGNVDESEVGKLRDGMSVRVTVDAFPDEIFHGRITQLRFSSTVTQGVVTYPAVIDVENPRHRLRPGMTATLSVETSRVTDTVRVPNGALRYQPKDQPRPRVRGPHSSHDGVVWVLDGHGPTARPHSVRVVTGITDGRYTQIVRGALTPGAVVVLDEGTAGPSGAATGGSSGGGSKRGPRIF